MRRTKEEAEKTRIAILTSAEQLFLERGVAHTSLDQIARHAGVTRGAVYWHFQNKAHLFHEMLSQVRLPPEQLAERMSGCDQGDPLEALFRLSSETLTLLKDDERRLRVFTILLHRCEFTEELKEAEERHYAFVDLFIQLCQELFAKASDRLQPGVTPRIAAHALHGLVVGLFTDWTRKPEVFNREDPAELFRPLFRGLVRDWRL
ncbi:TetR family transcriptional regulator [Stutzerimonas tarimensis]|uniref:TetR family transcriptional regulator n=1 Tax=Stutzerimonas tarimensis TaxID=1507735 RepID=A0ABV7T850_9GAMM